nr:hypothetical protein [Tanacetum cinerariifolium]
MADNRTMAQLLQAPIEGYEDAIVVPPINANNFKDGGKGTWGGRVRGFGTVLVCVCVYRRWCSGWGRFLARRFVKGTVGQPCDGYYCESCTCPQCGMTLFNGICDNCIYGAGMPIICTTRGGIVRGGLCLPCDLREKNLYNYDPNAYSFDNSNHFPQPQDENYLCNLCGNNSHDGYDCQQQFPFVYEQEPSYNQNYDDNYYSYDLPSFPCCDYCGGSHETFQCQPDNQNADIKEVLHDREKFIQDIQTFLEKFNRFSFGFTPRVLTIAWERIDKIKEYLEKSPDVVTTILPTEEPEHSLSIGECEVTSEDEIECDKPAKDESSLIFTTFSNPLFDYNDDLDSSDDESLSDEDVPAEEFKIYSNPLFDEDEINSDKLDPHCFNNLLYDNSFPRSPKELNAEIIESIPLLPISVQDGNSQQEEIDIVTQTDDVLPPSAENDDDDLSNNLLLGEEDLFLSDNSIPPGIENVADDPGGDIRFLEELFINSILSHESSDSNFEDNPSISRPPPEPFDDNFDLEPEVISAVMEDIDKPDEHFNPGGDIFVSTNNEDVDYFPFMFVIRIFLPYLILPEMFLFLLFAESEDTIFDPGISD